MNTQNTVIHHEEEQAVDFSLPRETTKSDNESVQKQGHMWVIIISMCHSPARGGEEMKWKSQCGDSWGGESVTLLHYTSVRLKPSESASPHVSVYF